MKKRMLIFGMRFLNGIGCFVCFQELGCLQQSFFVR